MKKFLVIVMMLFAFSVSANAQSMKAKVDSMFSKENAPKNLAELQAKADSIKKMNEEYHKIALKKMGLDDNQVRFMIENRYAVNKFMEVIDGKIVYNIRKEDFMKIGLPEVIFDTMNRDCDNINKMYQNPNRNIADAEKPLQEMKEMLKKDWHGYNTVAEMVAAENK